MKYKCKNCKYNVDKYCMYFKQEIRVKKSCWAFEDKIERLVKNEFLDGK